MGTAIFFHWKVQLSSTVAYYRVVAFVRDDDQETARIDIACVISFLTLLSSDIQSHIVNRQHNGKTVSCFKPDSCCNLYRDEGRPLAIEEQGTEIFAKIPKRMLRNFNIKHQTGCAMLSCKKQKRLST